MSQGGRTAIICVAQLVLPCWLACVATSMAGGMYEINDVKAAYLLNFGRFVEWPTSVMARFPEQINICLIGKDSLLEPLKRMTQDQTVQARPLVIKKLDDVTEIRNCQIVYLNIANRTDVLRGIALARAGKILTVSDAPNFVRIGGMIQFNISGERLRFAVNIKAAEDAGLKISSKLLRVAGAAP